MTESRRSARPRSGPVFWASILLFAAVFALLTHRLASESVSPSGAPTVRVRKVIQRRVVTTVVPTPGPNRVASGPATSTGGFAPVAEPVVTSAS